MKTKTPKWNPKFVTTDVTIDPYTRAEKKQTIITIRQTMRITLPGTIIAPPPPIKVRVDS